MSSMRILLVLSALALSAQPATANPMASPFGIMFILVPVNFPINGFVLVMMYLLFISFRGRPSPVGTWNFIELFLEGVLIITLLGAVIDTFALFTSEMMFASAAFIGVLTFWVAYSVLRMTLGWSVLTGIVFFLTNIFSWVLILGMTFSFPIVLVFLCIITFIFFFLLVRTAYTMHRIDEPVVWDERPFVEGGGQLPHGTVRGSDVRKVEDNLSEMRVYSVVLFAIVLFIGLI